MTIMGLYGLGALVVMLGVGIWIGWEIRDNRDRGRREISESQLRQVINDDWMRDWRRR